MARVSLRQGARLRQRTPRDAFPSPFAFNKHEPIALVQLRMHWFSGKIRSKPNWWEKVNDPDIVAKWRQEIVEQDSTFVDQFWGGEKRVEEPDEDHPKPWPRDPITSAQLEYIFEELQYVASQRDPVSGIFATAVHGVYESRSLIAAEAKDELVRGVSLLESVPEIEQDWHPGSNQQVLDLVHPSLYCLRIGKSYVRKKDPIDGISVEILTGEAYAALREDLQERSSREPPRWAVSERYQWLPTDFEVSATGEVKALGYINNLHPTQHGALYPPITSILTRFIPLFERVLSDSLSADPALAVQPDPRTWYDAVEEPEFDDERYDELYEEWWGKARWPEVPECMAFAPQPPEERVEYALKGRKLQVIVKLANIVLTPERPEYPGGSWHVEGMANERIVATGLYYYACENITESRLDFRMTVGTEGGYDMPYEQSDYRGYRTVYGFAGEDSLNQPLGHIVAEEDKCVAFPNVYQHHVDAFELADRSKPGFRKILCFFLVDPETEILSTTDVPPQQADWPLVEMDEVPALEKLPQELFDMVVNHVKEGTITRKEAEEDRALLMQERSQFVKEHNEFVYEVEFNMCEH